MTSLRIARRRFVGGALAAAAASPLTLRAQPRVDTLRVVLGYPPGGSMDIVARRIGDKLVGTHARHVVIENRPGAAGRLAVDAVKSAPADGTTLLVTPGSVVTIYPHIYRGLQYDPFADLAPVSMVAITRFAFSVGASVPASVRSLADFVAWSKAQGAPVGCGNAGAGSFQHFLAMLVGRETGIDLNHVPYKGSAAAMTALAGGEIPCSISTESSAMPMHQAGRIRVLATTGPSRSEFFPQAPSFGELGRPALVQQEWFASFMPRGTPAPIAAAAADSVAMALRDADLREAFRKAGLTAESSTPESLRQAQRAEYDFWGPLIRASGFTPEA